MIEVEYKIDLISSANRHDSTRDRMSRTKRHRDAAANWLLSRSRQPGVTIPKAPYVITLTRISHRKIRDEEDNLRHAWKATKDGVAIFLGIDDATSRSAKWHYVQEVKSKKDLGIVLKDQCVVRIRIESQEDHQHEYPGPAPSHTPGPWKIRSGHDPEEDHEHIDGPGGEPIALVGIGEDGGADARLIGAAPELLATLREVASSHFDCSCYACANVKTLIARVTKP
jgi:hypothetical protein